VIIIERKGLLSSQGLLVTLWAAPFVANQCYFIIDGHITVFERPDGSYSMKNHTGDQTISDDERQNIIKELQNYKRGIEK
jgi:hypothetical protein